MEEGPEDRRKRLKAVKAAAAAEQAGERWPSFRLRGPLFTSKSLRYRNLLLSPHLIDDDDDDDDDVNSPFSRSLQTPSSLKIHRHFETLCQIHSVVRKNPIFFLLGTLKNLLSLLYTSLSS